MGTSNRYIRVAPDGDNFYGCGSVVRGHNPTLKGLAAVEGECVFEQLGTWKRVTIPGKPQPVALGQVLKTSSGLPLKVVSVSALYSQQLCCLGIIREGSFDIAAHFDSTGTLLNGSHGRFGKVILRTGPVTTRLALIDEDGVEWMME